MYIRLAKIKKSGNSKHWCGCEKGKTLDRNNGNLIYIITMKNHLALPSKTKYAHVLLVINSSLKFSV